LYRILRKSYSFSVSLHLSNSFLCAAFSNTAEGAAQEDETAPLLRRLAVMTAL